jgi:uncharacterized membrane protein
MSSLYGILLVLVGSSLWGIGTVFFKKATMSVGAINYEKISSGRMGFLKKLVNWHFLAGGALSIVGWLIYLPGLSMGEASVVGPLAAMAYIAEIATAKFYIDEKINKTELLGIILIIIGISIIGSQGV